MNFKTMSPNPREDRIKSIIAGLEAKHGVSEAPSDAAVEAGENDAMDKVDEPETNGRLFGKHGVHIIISMGKHKGM